MNAFHQLNKDLCPITTLTKLIHIPCKVCTSITSLYSKLTGHIATKVENELFSYPTGCFPRWYFVHPHLFGRFQAVSFSESPRVDQCSDKDLQIRPDKINVCQIYTLAPSSRRAVSFLYWRRALKEFSSWYCSLPGPHNCSVSVNPEGTIQRENLKPVSRKSQWSLPKSSCGSI